MFYATVAALLIATASGFIVPQAKVQTSVRAPRLTMAATQQKDQFTVRDPAEGEPGASPTSLEYPGLSKDMETKPDYGEKTYRGTGRLKGRRAIITGGDSGIGRAVALAYAREGADVLISYLPEEEEDANETERLVTEAGQKLVKVPGDIRSSAQCDKIVEVALKELGGIDIVVNNAGYQMPQESLTDITDEQFDRTMKTGIYATFWLSRAALPHLKPGDTIINTASIFGFQSPPLLVDYATMKAAVVNFTKALGQQLISKGIRVNAVAPGPINTPMNPATMPDENIKKLGEESPIQRPGQPSELAPTYVFLASQESSYTTSEVIAVTGGMMIV